MKVVVKILLTDWINGIGATVNPTTVYNSLMLTLNEEMQVVRCQNSNYSITFLTWHWLFTLNMTSFIKMTHESYRD